VRDPYSYQEPEASFENLAKCIGHDPVKANEEDHKDGEADEP
jgi:hypothetical protein